MARSEARLSVDIWAPESDFTELTADAQWMYCFLLSQPDLAHTGVLALRERRWSRAARGLTVEAINNRLAELAAARYVVIDEQTEELLVRSFIRRDKVYRQPQVLRNAADQLPLVVSTALRRAIAVELTRVSQEPMPEPSKGILAEMLAALPNPADYPPADPPTDPPDQGAGEAARTGPGERGEVTAVRSASPYPVPRTPDPDPRSPEPPQAAAPARVRVRASPTPDEPPADAPPPGHAEQILTAWIGGLRRRPQARIVAAIGVTVQAALAEGQEPDDVREALRRWQARGTLGPGTLPGFIHEVANGPAPGQPQARASPTGQPQSTADSRVAQALAAGKAVQAHLDRREIGA